MTVQPATDSSLPPEAPSDFYSKPGPLYRKATHRFPAATYLPRNVAREERSFARDELQRTSRSVGRRVGGLSVAVLGLFGGLLLLVAVGRTTATAEVLTLWVLGCFLVVSIVRMVVLLRRHERDRDHLVDRVRAYEARLLELRSQRQRLA